MARRERAPYTARPDSPGTSTPGDRSSAMKLKIRNSTSKKKKKTGFLTRQKSAGGRKVNKRQRARHGSF